MRETSPVATESPSRLHCEPSPTWPRTSRLQWQRQQRPSSADSYGLPNSETRARSSPNSPKYMFVASPSRLTLARSEGLFEWDSRLRPVDQHQVDVVEAERIEAGLQRTCEVVRSGVLFGDFRGDPEILARNTGGADRLADPFLGSVLPCAVSMCRYPVAIAWAISSTARSGAGNSMVPYPTAGISAP